MRSKKLYIILIVSVLVFFLVMFLAFGVRNVLQENYEATIIVGDSSVWNYHNKKWTAIKSDATLQELNWKKFETFIDNEKFGDYYVWRDDSWYLFDENRNNIPIEGNLLAYRANYDLNVTEFSEDDELNFLYINSVFVDRGISLDSTYTNASHIAFDFDSDGVEEDFYLITNSFPIDFEPDVNFSFVFMVKDEQIYYLYDAVNSNNNYNNCKPFFNSFLDVNNDHVFEIILSCGRYSIEEQIDMLYQFQEGAFKIVISNQ